jgi:hypothetical protein
MEERDYPATSRGVKPLLQQEDRQNLNHTGLAKPAIPDQLHPLDAATEKIIARKENDPTGKKNTGPEACRPEGNRAALARARSHLGAAGRAG